IERSDIDAQLERIRRHDRANVAASQALFDVATLLGKIAATVAANRFVRERQLRAGVLEIRGEHFRGKAVIREHQRLLLLADEFESNAAALMQIAAADTELPVHYRRIIKDEGAVSAGGAIFGDELDGLRSQRLSQMFWIGEGGRAADKPRFRAIEFADALQPAQN